MAKHGNKKSGDGGGKSGVCTQCKVSSDKLIPVRWHSSTGKGRMVKLCDDCMPAMK